MKGPNTSINTTQIPNGGQSGNGFCNVRYKRNSIDGKSELISGE
jgi:hypothetical protein